MIVNLFRQIVKKYILILFLLFLIINLLLNILSVLNYNFPFTTDQGHDILDIRRIVIEKRLLLIGPPTSIPGLFHGPFWFYFNVPPFIAGNGDPSFLVYWIILWYSLAAIALWYFLKKSPWFALFTISLFLFNPALLYQSRYSLNSNIIPVAAVFYFLLLVNFLTVPALLKALLLGLLAGILLQIEAGFGVMFFPFLLITLIICSISLKNIFLSIIGFGLTLAPQFLFELRHNFLMTKSFTSEIFGSGEALGKNLTVNERFITHVNSFVSVVKNSLSLPEIVIYVIFILGLIFLILKLKSGYFDNLSKKYFLVSGGFIIFAFLAYLLYPHPLKGWFLNGLYIPFLIILATIFWEIFRFKNNLFIKMGIIGLLTISIINTLIIHSKFIYLGTDNRSGDPSNLRNEIEAVKRVYEKANGRPFKVFNYMPSVYDYPYQYIFWWYGNKKGYHPDTVSYLENVPEYISNNSFFFNKRKIIESQPLVFLIMEQDTEVPERKAAWLGNFVYLCLQSTEKYPWGTEIQERTSCK